MAKECWCVVASKDLVAEGEIHLVTTENVESRAHQIAAAPELLAACAQALPFLPLGSDAYRECLVAIAKAKGQTE